MILPPMFGLSSVAWRLVVGAAFASCFILIGMGVHKTFSDRKIAKMQAEFSDYKEKAAQKALEVEREYREKEAALQAISASLHAQDAAALRALNARFSSLRDELAATRDKLKAAETAPAECRDYAAPPTQLSTMHAVMVAELATAADVVVLERNSCVVQYEAAREELSRIKEASEK